MAENEGPGDNRGGLTGTAVRDFDVVTLELFLAVIDEGNMMRAAERQHITVSAVSRRIAALEARAGVRLLERGERGVVPTAAGMELASGAKRVMRLLSNLAVDLDAHRTGLSGLIRVHAHTSAITSVLMRSIATYRSRRDGIKIFLEEDTSVEVIGAVNSSRADLGFISGTVDASGLSVFPWMTDELVAVVPVNHPLVDAPRVQLQDLLAHPFVTMQRGSALVALFEQAARRIGHPLLPCAHLANFEGVRLMVEAGLGVTILPKTSVPVGHNIVPLTLSESWAIREINICCREPSQLAAATRSLLDHFVLEGAGRHMADNSSGR